MANGELSAERKFIDILAAIDASEPFEPLQIAWSQDRIRQLIAKIQDSGAPAFERNCALGQLTAAGGFFAPAKAILRDVLCEFRAWYPHHGHLIEHVLQLGLCLQAYDVVAEVLNHVYDTPGFFEVFADQEGGYALVRPVEIAADPKRCRMGVEASVFAGEAADHCVRRWASSAPLWIAYARWDGFAPGRTLMNSGDVAGRPGLAYCGAGPEFRLVPDVCFLESGGYADLRRAFDAQRPAWEARKDIAYWRGATTGVRTSPDWRSLPRIALCEISRRRPDLLDAALSAAVQTRSESERREIESSGLLRAWAPPEDCLNYKYQIDIDGNTNSWPGLIQKLLTGSPVLKVASPHGYRQWYYDRLAPFANCVPVAADMSDLLEKIDWLKSHAAEARAIGEAGLALARSLDYEGEVERALPSLRAALTDAPP